MDVGQYFAHTRYFNTIIGPWDLSRTVDNGRLYISIEYNVFWTGLARSGLVRTGPDRSGPGPVRIRSGVRFDKLEVIQRIQDFKFFCLSLQSRRQIEVLSSFGQA